MSEDFAGISPGSITWSITNRKFVGEPCVCLTMKINGVEFVSISCIINKKYKNDNELLNEISDAHELLVDRVPPILGAYGLVNLIQNIGQKNLRFVYVMDGGFIGERLGMGNTSVN